VTLRTDLRALQQGGDPEIHERVDLRAWTALGVGGSADLLIRCRSADGLQRALDLLATHGQRWLVLGSGSRLVPPDRGLRVPLLNLSGNMGLWELDLEGAVAGGGANMAQVCRAAARTGLPAMAEATRVSGTVGGAVDASLRGYCPFEDLLLWAEVAGPGRPIERLHLDRRRSKGTLHGRDLRRRVVVRARLHLADGAATARTHRLGRGPKPAVIRQPRCAWPFLVTPDGNSAESLLAETARGGLSVGGAQLSTDFPNQVCTSKTARAADVIELARTARERVLKTAGIVLRPAMRFVDEEGEDIEL
jgi:UDP-N-acetylmuramate dehydrogenase